MNQKFLVRLVVLFIAVFTVTFIVLAQVAPSVIVTNDDTLIGDSNEDGLADSGDTIRYTVVVANCGSGIAENVQYRTDIDSNTELIPDSVTRSDIEPITDDVCGDPPEDTSTDVVDTSAEVAEPDDSPSIDANARDDLIGVTVGATNTANLLSNDAGDEPLVVVSFGDSVANVGATPADGTTPLIIAGVEITIAANGVIDVDATGATGSGTISIFYLIEAGNGTTDIGQIDISYGDFPTTGDDTLANGVTFSTTLGTPFNNTSVGYQTLLNNDTLGTPAATLVGFGGGDLPGNATRFTVPTTRSISGVGTLEIIDGAGNFEFTPDAGFTGTVTFQYRIENSLGFSDGTVEIYVEEAPVAVDDTYQISLGDVDATNNVITDSAGEDNVGAPPAQVDFYADAGGIGLGGEVAAGGTYTHPTGNFTVVIQADGSITIDASGGSVVPGAYTFDYQITNTVDSSVATVTVEIGAGPVAQDDAFALALGTDLTGGDLLTLNPNPGGTADTVGTPPFDELTFGGGDLGGSVTSNTATAGGTDVGLAGGTLTITSAGGIDLVGATTAGTFTFDYELTSTTLGLSDTATVTVVIDAPPTVTLTSPADMDTDVASNATIDITFSEDVNIAGDWITILCSVSGTFSPSNTNISVVPATGPATSFEVTPTGGFATAGETCVVTLVAAQITDNDTDPAPEPISSDQLDGNGDFTGGDDFTFMFSTSDVPPSVTGIVPNDTATGVASDTTIDITFSEDVDLNGNWIQLVCTNSGTLGIGTGLTSAPTAGPTGSAIITVGGGLQSGETCDVTIFSNATNGVTDNDAIDPPDLLDGNGDGTAGDDFASSFTVDVAITVTTVDPADASTGVAVDEDIVVTFSEAPTLNGGWFDITCTGGSNVTTGNSAVSTVGNVISIDPDNPFAVGEVCTLTVNSDATNGVTDADAGDPPNLLDGNGDGTTGDAFVSTFSTADTVPTVTTAQVEQGGVFGASTTDIDPDTDIQIVFSEPVNVTGNWASVTCAPSGASFSTGAGTIVVTGGNPSTTFTLNPTSDLPFGDTCTLTLGSMLVTDNDVADPPDELDGDGSGDIVDGDADDFTFAFTIDLAITVATVDPADGSTDVAVDEDVVITFSDAPTLNGDWFDITCSRGSTVTTGNSAVTLVGNTVTINPDTDFAVGEICTFTINSDATNGVTDADAGDPPNLLDGNGDGTTGDAFVSTFSTADTPPTLVSAEVERTGFVSTIPTADTIQNDTDIRLTFSEDVNFAGGAFEVVCASVDVTGDYTAGATPATIVTLTYGGAGLTDGATCDVTLDSTLITDNDAVAPDQLDGNGNNIEDGSPTDDVTFDFTVDTSPSVTSVEVEKLDALGDIADDPNDMDVDIDTTVVFNFSEPINVPSADDWVTLTCTSSGIYNVTGTGGTPFADVNGDGTDTVTLTVTGNFTTGETCTVAIDETLVTDADAGDPPDTLLTYPDDTFTIISADTAPSVTSVEVQKSGTRGDIAVSPNDIGVDADTALIITFSEPVVVMNNWLTVSCTITGDYNVTGSGATFDNILLTTATEITVLFPTALAAGETCTVSLDETEVTDADALDPPDELLPYTDDDFTILDEAPTVVRTQVEVGSTSTDTMTSDVNADTTITINFSESVDVTGAWFTLVCDSGDVTGQFTASTTPATSVTLTNGGANLPAGEECTLTLDSALVTDTDPADPPNTLNGDDDGDTSDADAASDTYSTSFTIDGILQVNTVTPADGTNNVDPVGLTIDINFVNGPADVSATGVVLECGADLDNLNPVGTTAGLGVSGVTGVSLTPDFADPDFEPGNLCRVTVVADQTTDSDASDPPDGLDGDEDGISEGSPSDDFIFIFELQPETALDMVSLLGNVSYDSAIEPLSVFDNDSSPAQTLNVTVPGGNTTSCGGFVDFDTTTGEFQYNPPPGYEGEDTFEYTVTTAGDNNLGSSDTGTVTLTVTDMIWFVTNTPAEFGVAGRNDGRLSDPFQSLLAFNAVQGGSTTASGAGCAGAGSEIVDPEPGDTIFFYDGSDDYEFGSGLSLLSEQTLVGQGATGGDVLSLANLRMGVTAVTGQPATAAPISSQAIPAQTGINPNLNSIGNNSLSLNTVGTSNHVYGVDLEINGEGEIGLFGDGFGTLRIEDVNIGDEDGLPTSTGIIMRLENGVFDTASNFGTLQSANANNNIIFLIGVGGSFTATSTTINQNTLPIADQNEGDSGIRIIDSTASAVFDFGQLTIQMGEGDSPADSIAISGSNNSGATIRSVAGSGVIINDDGPAFNLFDTTLDMVVTTIRSDDSGGDAIFFSDVGGSLSATETTINDVNNNGIQIRNTPSGATFNFGDPVTITNVTNGDGINVSTWQGTSLTFGVTTVTSAGNDGIELDNINAGRITFGVTAVGDTVADTGQPGVHGTVIQNSAASAINFEAYSAITANGTAFLLQDNNDTTVNVAYAPTNDLEATVGACVDSNNTTSVLVNLNIEFDTCTTTDSTNHGFRIGRGAGTLVGIRNTVNIDMDASILSNNPILIENTSTTTVNLADGNAVTNTVSINDRRTDGFRVDGFNGMNLTVGDYNDSNNANSNGSGIKIQNSSGAMTFRSTDISNTVQSTPRTLNADNIPTNDDDDGHGIFLLDNIGAFNVLGTGFQGDGGLILDIGNGSDLFTGPAAVEVRRANFSSLDLDVTMDVAANRSGPAVRIVNPLPGSTSTVDNMTVQNIADRAGAFDLRTNVNINGATINLTDFDAQSYVDGQLSTVLTRMSTGTVGTLSFNMTGTNAADTPAANCIIGNEDEVSFLTQAGTLDLLIDSCRIDGLTPGGGDGFSLRAEGVDAVITADITNNFLVNIASVGVRLRISSVSSGATLNANVADNTIDTAGGGIEWNAGLGSGSFENSRVTISNNTLTNISAVGMSILMSEYTGTFGDLRVIDNNIASNNEGILVSDGGGMSVLRLLVEENTVTSAADDAILVRSSTNIQATITNNTLTGADNDLDFSLNGGSTLCGDVQGNTFNNAVAANRFFSQNFLAAIYELTASSQTPTTIIGAPPTIVPDGTCELPTP